MSTSSYRQILRSSSIIGGASAINVLIVMLRTKLVAMLLGPAGVGMIGLLQNLLATASTISAFGFGGAGTRQIAAAHASNDRAALATARRALFVGSLGLAFAGAIIFWSLRGILAELVFHDPSMANSLGWLAIGVALTVASGSQGALLNGFRRIGDIAQVSILSALVSTLLGTGLIWAFGENAIIPFVLATPLASFTLGYIYVKRLPSAAPEVVSNNALIEQWRLLFQVGSALMIASLLGSLGQLLISILVQQTLGAKALGLCTAAMAISMTSIGFILQAMGTDYYPRLTALIQDHAAANRLVNEQTEVALLLSGPVLLIILSTAPWIIELLYSDGFTGAVSVLRWQIVGTLVKVVSWPIGYILLAKGLGRTFMMTEALATIIFVGVTWVGLPFLDIDAVGVAFLLMYMILLPVTYALTSRSIGFGWQAGVWRQFSLLLVVSGIICALAARHAELGGLVGLTFAAGLGTWNIRRLGQMTDLAGPVGRASVLGNKLLYLLNGKGRRRG